MSIHDELAQAREDLDAEASAGDLDVVLDLRYVLVRERDGGRVTGHYRTLSALEAPTLDDLEPRVRITLARTLRLAADVAEPPRNAAELYRCPDCGHREAIPNAELAQHGGHSRVCSGLIHAHAPMRLVPVPATPSRETNA